MRLIPTILAWARTGSVSFVLSLMLTVITTHLRLGRRLRVPTGHAGPAFRINIIVQPKHVRRIVHALHLGKPVVVAAVCGAHSLFALVAEKVDVDGST